LRSNCMKRPTSSISVTTTLLQARIHWDDVQLA
jgi:hypothetical protein